MNPSLSAELRFGMPNHPLQKLQGVPVGYHELKGGST